MKNLSLKMVLIYGAILITLSCTVQKYPLISPYYLTLIKIDTTNRYMQATGLLLTWQREDKTTYQEFAPMGAYVIGQMEKVKLQK